VLVAKVIELDGPHSMVVAAGTEVVSFVLLGDQNAGKSTFLHGFTHHPDPSFLELSSLLPVLAASFVNTRFLTKADPRYARAAFRKATIDMFSHRSYSVF
jgi:GTPase SAR1 family protein